MVGLSRQAWRRSQRPCEARARMARIPGALAPPVGRDAAAKPLRTHRAASAGPFSIAGTRGRRGRRARPRPRAGGRRATNPQGVAANRLRPDSQRSAPARTAPLRDAKPLRRSQGKHLPGHERSASRVARGPSGVRALARGLPINCVRSGGALALESPVLDRCSRPTTSRNGGVGRAARPWPRSDDSPVHAQRLPVTPDGSRRRRTQPRE